MCCFPVPTNLGKAARRPSILIRDISTNCLETSTEKKKGIHSKESITDPGLDLTHLGTVSKKKRQKVFSAQNVGRKNLFIDMKYIYMYVCMYVCMYRHTQIIS